MAAFTTIAQVFENYGIVDDIKLSSEEVDANTSSVLFKYNWLINLTNGLPKPLGKFISPEFPNRANSGITWYLTTVLSNRGVRVNLSLSSCNGQNVNAKYRFRYQRTDCYYTTSWVDAPSKIFKLNDTVDISDVIHIDYPNMDYYGSKLVLHCEITVPGSEVYPAHNRNVSINPINAAYSIQNISTQYQDNSTQYQDISTNPPNVVFEFAEELQTMFENEELSDVTFSIQGKELKAHKVILAAGSSVFKGMFEHDLKEKKHNRVEITDIDFEILRELIRYIYTKQVTDLDEIAKELLIASDKYDLGKLKNMCESVLCKNISTENVAEMFIFADTYNAVFLKTEAIDYIVGHSKDVSGTYGWKSMIMSHPHLIAEAFVALSEK